MRVKISCQCCYITTVTETYSLTRLADDDYYIVETLTSITFFLVTYIQNVVIMTVYTQLLSHTIHL